MSQDRVPFSFEVAVPEPYMRGFGVHATTVHGKCQFTFRLTPADRELLERAAKMLDLKTGEFVRDSAVNMANALIRHIEAFEKAKEKANVHDPAPDG